MSWQCFSAFYPLFSSTDMTDSFIWFILFLHWSDSFKFCFLQEYIFDFHILCSCSHSVKKSLEKASYPYGFLCYNTVKYKKATGMLWLCRVYNLKYDSLQVKGITMVVLNHIPNHESFNLPSLLILKYPPLLLISKIFLWTQFNYQHLKKNLAPIKLNFFIVVPRDTSLKTSKPLAMKISI